jgi:transcription-repair coupling factor (superfamily II helicase)
MKLLEEAVGELKGDEAAVQPEPRLLTDWSAFLPDEFVPDEHEKLALYRRLAESREIEQIDDLTLEVMDRFGQLPPPAVALIELRRLRVLARGERVSGASTVESLRVFQQVAEMTLKRPLTPHEIRTVVGALTYQVEFISGREFGLRVRGEGLALLHRPRELLGALALAVSASVAAPSG